MTGLSSPKEAAGRNKSDRMRRALEEFYARSLRKTLPEGSWQDGLWYPSAGERRACCEEIQPTTANRQALESHCRSQGHVAALYGLEVAELRAAVRDDRKQGSPIERYVASSFVGPRPRQIESFTDLSRNSRDEAFEELHAALSQSLPLLERLHSLGGQGRPEEGVGPLLDSASQSAERLVAILHSARRLETIASFGTALLDTFEKLLEQPRPKRRGRSGGGAATEGGKAPETSEHRPLA